MAIDSYANLKAAIISYSKRDDILDDVDGFIDMTESKINAYLRMRALETTSTLQMTAGQRWTTLPTDFIEPRRLTVISTQYYPLSFVFPQSLNPQITAGRPELYSITDRIEWNKPPNTAYDFELTYYKTVGALSDANTTNEVLSKYPDIYLYGCLAQLHLWETDTIASAEKMAIMMSGIESANQQEKRGRGVQTRSRGNGTRYTY